MVAQTTFKLEPIIPAEEDAGALRDAACSLAAATDDAVTLVLPDGQSVKLPASAVAALRLIVEAMSNNNAVAITPVDKRLTPTQAALMLNVQDDYFESLLTNGEIPFTGTEEIRRVALEDLLAFKRERDATRREALREMTRLSQEMGFYQPVESDPGIS